MSEIGKTSTLPQNQKMFFFKASAQEAELSGERCDRRGLKLLQFGKRRFENTYRYNPPNSTAFGDQPLIGSFLHFSFVSWKANYLNWYLCRYLGSILFATEASFTLLTRGERSPLRSHPGVNKVCILYR
jgi:hypothetical protein